MQSGTVDETQFVDMQQNQWQNYLFIVLRFQLAYSFWISKKEMNEMIIWMEPSHTPAAHSTLNKKKFTLTIRSESDRIIDRESELERDQMKQQKVMGSY